MAIAVVVVVAVGRAMRAQVVAVEVVGDISTRVEHPVPLLHRQLRY